MTADCRPKDQVLNIAVLSQLIEDIGFLRVNVVIEMSILDLKKLHDDVSNGVKQSDWSALRIAAHSLLGVSSIMGADKLRNVAQELETHCTKRNFILANTIAAEVLLSINEFSDRLRHYRKLEDGTNVMQRHRMAFEDQITT